MIKRGQHLTITVPDGRTVDLPFDDILDGYD